MLAACLAVHAELDESCTTTPVLSLPVQGLGELELSPGDEPCAQLDALCARLPPTAHSSCHEQLMPVLHSHLSANWSDLRPQIVVKDSFFCGCVPCNLRPNDASTPQIPSPQSAKLLELLEHAVASRDPQSPHLKTYNARQKELASPLERAAHFRAALDLVPSTPFVVDQLGIALTALGKPDTARLLYGTLVARGIWPSVDQRPTTYIQGIPSKPWHDSKRFEFVRPLRLAIADIAKEFDQLDPHLAAKLITLQNEGIHTGGWRELVLKKHGVWSQAVLQHGAFPLTVATFEQVRQQFPSNDLFNLKFSLLAPGTAILPHCGPSNKRLRLHLTLRHADGAFLRVGTTARSWKAGRAMVFDDSWEHEVWHNGTDERLILIADFWHPALPRHERYYS